VNRQEAADSVRQWMVESLPVESIIKAVTDIVVGWLQTLTLSDDQRKALLYFADEVEKVITSK